MRNQRGLSGSVQTTVLLTFVILLFLSGLQWALVSWATTVAHAAAQDGARAAAALHGTEDAGVAIAREAADSPALSDVQVDIWIDFVETTAVVEGRALVLVPFIPARVRAEASAPTERVAG